MGRRRRSMAWYHRQWGDTPEPPEANEPYNECPECDSELVEDGDTVHCSNEECEYSKTLGGEDD